MRIGPHVNRYHAAGARPSIVAHIDAARREAKYAADFDISAVAIFVGGPKNRVITITDAEVDELHEYIRAEKLCVIAHSTYTAPPWRGDPDAARFIRAEVAVCRRAGISGLVVHLPKLGVETVMRYISRLIEPSAGSDVRIYLEMPAVSPKDSHYETPAKLIRLFRAIRAEVDPRLHTFGLCIDTAHLWTCGVDLSSYESAHAWLAELEAASAVIPADRIMLHLNDSERELGHGPDSHAGLGAGRMWPSLNLRQSGEASGLDAFVEYAQRHNTPTILERKPKEALVGDYTILRRIIVPTIGACEDTPGENV